MYAHQVIEDLKVQHKTNDNEYGQQNPLLIDLINKSQKFHLGDVDKHGLVDKYTGMQLFNDPEQENIRFPYQTTWIDWSDNNEKPDIDHSKGVVFIKKQGALITTLKEKYHNIFLFHHTTRNQSAFVTSDSVWTMCPVFFNLYFSESHKNFIVQNSYLKPLQKLGKKAISHIAEESSREMTTINVFIDLINCKNIGTLDNDAPEKLNKKRAKSGKCPLFTYKTLVIKPTGKKQAQNEAQGLWENRVHLCRGHFKTYTEDNPLFGRLTGRYWWQPSVRGNKKKGVVMKDYKVVAA